MKIAIRNSWTFPHTPLKFSIKSVIFFRNEFNYFPSQLKIVLKKFRKSTIINSQQNW
jgi:hypothetical protein